MATEIADAYIALYTKMPGVKGDIERGLGAADARGAGAKLGDGLGDGISSRSAAIAGAVGGVVAVVAQRAMSGVTDLIGDAAAASDATDKFKQTLGFAGLDTSVIEKVTKQTRKYADDTVFDLSTIQNTTAQLAANGVPNYEKLTEAAGNLNAVAGGNNDTFSSVAMVLTQTAGAGKLTTENWNQLANAIPGASGILMKSLADAGAYTGNFRDAMAKGEITSDEFNTALMKVGSQPIAVEAAKSTSTFEGAIGNLQATIVGKLSDAINGAKPMLTGLISGVADAFSTAVDVIGGIGSFVKDNMAWVGPIAAAVGAMVGVWAAWNLVMGIWQTITKISTAVQVAFNLVMNANPVFLVITAIAALVAGLVFFFTQTELGRQIWEGFTQFLGEAWDNIVSFISGAIDFVVQFVQEHWGLLLSFLIGPIGLAIQWIVEHWSEIMAWITDVIDGFVGWWQGIWSAVGSFLSDAWLVIVGFVQGYINTVLGIISGVLGTISGVWQSVWGGIRDFFGGIWDGIVGVAKGAINGIIGLINGLVGGFNQVGNFIADISGGAIKMHIPKIPMLANGGTLMTAGSVLVGERGPEILDLPQGASVIPLDERQDSGIAITVERLVVREEADIRKVAVELKRLVDRDKKGV